MERKRKMKQVGAGQMIGNEGKKERIRQTIKKQEKNKS